MRGSHPLDAPWASRMRDLQARFDKEHREETGPGALLFDKTLIQRSRNPHATEAVRLLSGAIYEGDIPSGNTPGLEIPAAALNDPDIAQMRIETPKMISDGRALLVMRDLSLIYIDHSAGLPDRRVKVLPTPLALRSTVSRGEQRLLHLFRVKEGATQRIRLTLGEEEVVVRDLVAGQTDHGPRSTELTQAWISQLDAEVAALARRRDRMKERPAIVPPSRSAGKLPYLPRFGSLPMRAMRPAHASFLARKVVSDDDLHLGTLLFDPEDPLLEELGRATKVALDLARSEVPPEDLRGAAVAGIVAPSPWSGKAEIFASTQSTKTIGKIVNRMTHHLGSDVLTLASRYRGFLDALPRREHTAGLLHLSQETSRETPSNHRLLSLHGEMAELRARFKDAVQEG